MSNPFETTLTWADVFIHLGIALAAAFAIWAISKASRLLWIWLSDQWAQRSRRSASSQIEMLERALKRYETDVAGGTPWIARLILVSVQTIFSFIIGGAAGMLAVLLDTTTCFAISGQNCNINQIIHLPWNVNYVPSYSYGLLSLAFLTAGVIGLSQLSSLSHPNEYKGRLRNRIAALEAKLSNLPS